MRRGLCLLLVGLAGLAALLPAADANVELFRDDFSRYPVGPLSRPLGELNPAIQEYHYLAHRGVPLGPWANAITYLDSWVVGEEDGKPYLEQHMSPSNRRMAPETFSPLFITGQPEWGDYTVEVDMKPLSTGDFAGVAFRYHTNRHFFLFGVQKGKEARLALRLPLEKKFRIAEYQELARADFPYDDTRYLHLKVETSFGKIRCYIDGKLLISAESEELPRGKVGVTANIPARFRDFRVSTSAANKKLIEERVRKRAEEEKSLQAANPKPRLWKKFETPVFGAGRNVRFGDLDGDGQIDMLIAQNIPKVDTGNFVEITSMTAVTLDGKVLWTLGQPNKKHGLLTSDTPFQAHDLDGTGRCDVVMVKDYKIQVLDGRTGKLKRSTFMPKLKGYPKVNQPPPTDWPHDRDVGDSILFVNFSGGKERTDIVIKDRYWNFWVFNKDLKLLWTGQGMLGHYPYPTADGAAGRDRLAIGYALWDHTGKQLWSADNELKDHADSVFYGNISGDPKEQPMGYYSGSDEGFILIDHRGVIARHVRVGHAQTACIGKFRPDVQGLQYMTINFWKNPGIVSLFDYQGKLLQQEEPIHSGAPMLPVNWRGDGSEVVLLSGNVHEGGMIDGHMRRAVMFPDDGHPDLCAAVMNLTGDARDEIILWDQEKVWIYTQDRPFEGSKIYAPRRSPDYNESNYRCTVSLPGWEEVKK